MFAKSIFVSAIHKHHQGGRLLGPQGSLPRKTNSSAVGGNCRFRQILLRKTAVLLLHTMDQGELGVATKQKEDHNAIAGGGVVDLMAAKRRDDGVRCQSNPTEKKRKKREKQLQRSRKKFRASQLEDPSLNLALPWCDRLLKGKFEVPVHQATFACHEFMKISQANQQERERIHPVLEAILAHLKGPHKEKLSLEALSPPEGHIEGHIASASTILGKRHEIHVKNCFTMDGEGEFPTQTWDEIAGEVGEQLGLRGEDVTAALISHASRKASELCPGHHFSSFSLIVSCGTVAAQDVHMDLMCPQAQFGLALEDDTTATEVHRDPPPLSTTDEAADEGDQLVRMWSSLWQLNDNRHRPLEETKNSCSRLVKAMQEEPEVVELLSSFGAALCPREFLTQGPQMERNLKLQAGSVHSIPGGVLHNSPPARRFRAILFFTGGHPFAPGAKVCDSNVQWSGVALALRITQLLWRKVEIQDRCNLLLILLHCLGISKCPECWQTGALEPLAAHIVQSRRGKKTTAACRRRMGSMPVEALHAMAIDATLFD